MKKLLFLLLIFVSTLTYSQSLRKLVLTSNYSLADGDTTFYISTSDNYAWSVTARWTHLDTNNAVLTIQNSYDGTNWMNYAGSLTTTLTDTASGVCGFEDYQTTFNFLRVKVEVNDVDTGFLWLNATLRRNE